MLVHWKRMIVFMSGSLSAKLLQILVNTCKGLRKYLISLGGSTENNLQYEGRVSRKMLTL